MLVTFDSPLRRLPIGLDREQTLFIDGVRVSAEIVDLAHSRLVATLDRVSEPDCPQAGRQELIVSAVQDAWTLVDAFHRIRCLLRRMPHVKKSSPPLQVFLRASSDVEPLRHVVQHLDSEMPRIVSLGAPVWGVLRWLVVLDRARWRLRTCAIAAGTAFDSVYEVQHPEGKKIRGRVDHISLMSSGKTVDLSDVYYALAKFVSAMEATLATSFSESPSFGSDLVTVLEMQSASGAEAGEA